MAKKKNHQGGIEGIGKSRKLTQWSNTTNNTTKEGEPVATMPLTTQTVAIIMLEVMGVARAVASASKR